jgi:hypothetical protein
MLAYEGFLRTASALRKAPQASSTTAPSRTAVRGMALDLEASIYSLILLDSTPPPYIFAVTRKTRGNKS